MSQSKDGQISFSFMRLHELSKCFDALERGDEIPDEEIFHLLLSTGTAALPMLSRKRKQGGRGRLLAGRFLDLLSVVPEFAERVEQVRAEECRQLGSNAHQAFASLAATLVCQSEVARAVQILLDDTPHSEILDLLRDFATHQRRGTLALCQEFMARDTLPLPFRQEVLRLVVSLGLLSSAKWAENQQKQAAHLYNIRLAENDSGERLIVAFQALRDCEETRFRCISLLLCPQRGLIRSDYYDDLMVSELRRRVFRPLEERGFQFRTIALQDARAFAVDSLRRRHPSIGNDDSFYLGRDMLGIRDEHTSLADRQSVAKGLLAPAAKQMRLGNFAEARTFLEYYLQFCPREAESESALGHCYLELGERQKARLHLERASALAPGNAQHHWNLAALAYDDGRFGDCFTQLRTFLGCNGKSGPQIELARRFIANYKHGQTRKLGQDRLQAAWSA